MDQWRNDCVGNNMEAIIYSKYSEKNMTLLQLSRLVREAAKKLSVLR